MLWYIGKEATQASYVVILTQFLAYKPTANCLQLDSQDIRLILYLNLPVSFMSGHQF